MFFISSILFQTMKMQLIQLYIIIENKTIYKTKTEQLLQTTKYIGLCFN